MAPTGSTPCPGDKAERRAARELIASYHQSELRALLERVRAGFGRLDAGEIDEFELDDLIHHYKRAAGELWKFCGSTGGQWVQAANALKSLREKVEELVWWDRPKPRRPSCPSPRRSRTHRCPPLVSSPADRR